MKLGTANARNLTDPEAPARASGAARIRAPPVRCGAPLGGKRAALRGGTTSSGFTGGLLFGVGDQRVAHPGAVLVRLDARGEAFAVAGAVALEHGVELGPVD